MQEKRRAIVVDDEPIVRMDVSEMLRAMKIDVVAEAGDGFDAVELCRVHLPTLVVMDARMPIFDGLTAARTITEKQYCDCVVLLTAYQDRDMIAQATNAGVCGYLVKPIDQTRFAPAIEVALSQAERLRQSEARAQKALEKAEESKKIFQAQKLLSELTGCPVTESYQTLRKLAMDKRMPIAQAADEVLRRFAEQKGPRHA